MATPFRRHRDVHLISRNGFFSLEWKTASPFILEFPLLIILARLSSSPPALFCCSSLCIPEKAELAGIFRGRDRNDAGLPRWLHREQCGWQSCCVAPGRLCFPGQLFLGCSHSSACVHCWNSEQAGWELLHWILQRLHQGTLWQWFHSAFTSVEWEGIFLFPFFLFLIYFCLLFWVFFFLKPTWQHQRFLPLLMASCSSLLLLAVPQHSSAFVCKENALLRAMPLLPAFTSGCQALQSWAFVLGCKALQSWTCALGTWFKVTAKQRHLWTWL